MDYSRLKIVQAFRLLLDAVVGYAGDLISLGGYAFAVSHAWSPVSGCVFLFYRMAGVDDLMGSIALVQARGVAPSLNSSYVRCKRNAFDYLSRSAGASGQDF